MGGTQGVGAGTAQNREWEIYDPASQRTTSHMLWPAYQKAARQVRRGTGPCVCPRICPRTASCMRVSRISFALHYLCSATHTPHTAHLGKELQTFSHHAVARELQSA